jgi:SAM-dependent methyltransferase
VTGPSSNKPACVCGATQYSPVLRGTYDRLLLHDYAFEVVRCNRCALARTLPVPDQRQYDSGYALTTEDGRFVGAHEDGWSERTVRYVRRRAGGSRLIDVGCSVGNLVAAAKAHGYEAVGIDPDCVATAEGRRLGREVRAGRIEDVAEESFDVAVANQVVEHVLDVRGFFAALERVLAPGGYAFILVPHYRGLMPRLMRDHWIGWFPSQHVWHFTPTTLKHVAEGSSGLRLVEYTTKGVIEPPSAGLRGYVKAAVTACSHATGWGDEIEALFQKAPHGSNGH